MKWPLLLLTSPPPPHPPPPPPPPSCSFLALASLLLSTSSSRPHRRRSCTACWEAYATTGQMLQRRTQDDAFRLPGVGTSAWSRRPISAKLLQFATSPLFFPPPSRFAKGISECAAGGVGRGGWLGQWGGAGKSLQTLLEG